MGLPGEAGFRTIVLVSGMAIGTIFTLFVVPSIYLLVAKNPARACSNVCMTGVAGGERLPRHRASRWR